MTLTVAKEGRTLLSTINTLLAAGLPRSRKKSLENEVFSRLGNFIFSQGNLEKKMKKEMGRKVRDFFKNPKELIDLKQASENYINCKHFIFRNIPYLIFMV